VNPAASNFDLNQHIGELLALCGRDFAQNTLNLFHHHRVTFPAGVARRR
jgi:hypothetical protein